MRTAAISHGDNGPVFAGTQVPVRALIEHLKSGASLEEFLDITPGLAPSVVHETLIDGLERLTAVTRARQASLLPQTDGRGAITNTDELTADQVIGRSVLCPGCKDLIFKSWPEGWDAHAAHRCLGIKAKNPSERKIMFKRRFAYLFR